MPCKLCGWTSERGTTCGYCLEIAEGLKAQQARLKHAKSLPASHILDEPERLQAYAASYPERFAAAIGTSYDYDPELKKAALKQAEKQKFRVVHCEKCRSFTLEALFEHEQKDPERGTSTKVLICNGEARSSSYRALLCDPCNTLQELLIQFKHRKFLMSPEQQAIRAAEAERKRLLKEELEEARKK